MYNIRHLVRKLHDAAMYLSSPASHSETQNRRKLYRDLGSIDAVMADGKVSVRGITVYIEPDRVVETVHEVALRDDYAFSGHSGSYVMIDIGMNVGIAAILKATDPRFTTIYAFEPLRPTYKLALRNIEINPAAKVKIKPYNFGLSDEDASLTIKFTPDHIMSISSESTFDACYGKNVTNEPIEVKKASTIIEPIIINHRRKKNENIFLKIDCEGAEFRILEDLDQHGLLNEIDVAVIEWHGRDPHDILNLLTKNGFFWFTSLINPEWNVGLIKAAKATSVHNLANTLPIS